MLDYYSPVLVSIQTNLNQGVVESIKTRGLDPSNYKQKRLKILLLKHPFGETSPESYNQKYS